MRGTRGRLAGHTLRYEGKWWDFTVGHTDDGTGPARCSCGDTSPDLPSTAARRRWHRQHKDNIRAGVS